MSAPTVVAGHACLYCGEFDCPTAWECDREWRGHDEYARVAGTPAATACPRCGQSVNNGKPCPKNPLAARAA